MTPWLKLISNIKTIAHSMLTSISLQISCVTELCIIIGDSYWRTQCRRNKPLLKEGGRLSLMTICPSIKTCMYDWESYKMTKLGKTNPQINTGTIAVYLKQGPCWLSIIGAAPAVNLTVRGATQGCTGASAFKIAGQIALSFPWSKVEHIWS